MKSSLLHLRICTLLFLPALFALPPQASPVVTAYVFPRNGPLHARDFAPRKLSRVNYAFANIKKGRLVPGSDDDGANLQTLLGLKRDNPQLKVLISVGGWSWSGHFSDMTLTAQSRREFIDSAVQFIDSNSLDGLDVDWEYPGAKGAGNRFRAEDKTNYTALLRELRARFDRESKLLRRPLLLTIAAGGSQEWIDHTEMREVARYVDAVNLMSYDYYTPSGDRITGHHAPLFADPADPKHVSVDASVTMFRTAGVPPRKLILGIPFYGHAWKHVDAANHGLFQRGKKSDMEANYNQILPLLNGAGYLRYRDPVSSTPYLYNPEKQIFITYEDPQSVAAKCRYALKNKLGGVMFWEYSADADGALLDAIGSGLHGAILKRKGE